MPKSQEQQILDYLQAGNSLTPLDALEKFGCFRLGARVFDLIQQGYPIKSEIVKGENGKHFAKYYLAEHPTTTHTKAETAQGSDLTTKTGIDTPNALNQPQIAKNRQAQRQAFESRTGQFSFIG